MRQARQDRVLRLGQAVAERLAAPVELGVIFEVVGFDRVDAAVVADLRRRRDALAEERGGGDQLEHRRRRRPRARRQARVVGRGRVAVAPGEREHAPVVDGDEHRGALDGIGLAEEVLGGALQVGVEGELDAPAVGERLDQAAGVGVRGERGGDGAAPVDRRLAPERHRRGADARHEGEGGEGHDRARGGHAAHERGTKHPVYQPPLTCNCAMALAARCEIRARLGGARPR